MNSDLRSPAMLLADKTWRTRNSIWRWWAFAGFGFLGCVGFLIVAARVQSKKFWVAATAASLGSALSGVAAVLSEESSRESASAATTRAAEQTSAGVGFVVIAVWIGHSVLAVILNRDYLRWKADGRNEWYLQSTGDSWPSATAGAQAPPRTAQPFLGTDSSEFYADRSTPPPPPAPPSPAPPRPTAPAPEAFSPDVSSPMRGRRAEPTKDAGAVLDINSASAGEIAMNLAVGDHVVRRILEARVTGGLFRGFEDLVARASLQPHEMVKMRDRVVFGTASRGSASSSDQGADVNPPPAGGGRILDF